MSLAALANGIRRAQNDPALAYLGAMSPYQAEILRARPTLGHERPSAGIDILGATSLGDPAEYRRLAGNALGFALYRLARAGNKLGKTRHANQEADMWARGAHPTHPLPTPCRIVYVIADLENAYADDVCRVFREFVDPDDLHRDCRYTAEGGYTIPGRGARRRGLKYSNGSSIIFRSGTQDGAALAGLMGDALIVNEPPRERHWGEALRAVGHSGGPVLCVFTPMDEHGVSRDLRWLQTYVEGNASGGVQPRGNFVQIVGQLCPENAPHRDADNIRQQIAAMPAAEVAQRRDASWTGPATGRVFTNWDTSQRFDWNPDPSGEAWPELPGANGGEEVAIGVAIDHGEGAGREVALLYAYVERGAESMIWFLDEYRSPERTILARDAASIVEMLGRNGLNLHHVDRWHGDVNSAGKMFAVGLNRKLEQEFAALLGRARSSRVVTIQSAKKGRGSRLMAVRYGSRILNEALGSHNLWISSRCRALAHDFERWMGDERHKDGIDAARYGSVDLLEARMTALAQGIRT